MTNLFGLPPWCLNQQELYYLYCQYSPRWPNPGAAVFKPGQHYVAHDVSGASTTCSETSSLESSQERRLRGYLEKKI
eukprot:Skav203029  [mRNA]  locus=scaffold583:368668:369018:+ [translate_table: standard]